METIMISMIEAKQVGLNIVSIAKRGAKLDADIHSTAVQTLLHAEAHGDVTLATKLVGAMPKSGRVKGLIVWYHENSPLRFVEKEAQFKLDKGDKAKPFDIDAADAVPFYALDAAAEHTAKPFDLDAVNGWLIALGKRIDKGVLADIDADVPVLTDADLKKMRAIRDKIANIA